MTSEVTQADSGMDGQSVELAELVWANLPTNRSWASLPTYEKALVCHTLTRLTAQSGEGRSGAGEDVLRDAVRRFLPTNINLDAAHLPDEATIPLDVTIGELRELRAALRATDDAGGA